MKHWTEHRFVEPSTHTAIAVFLACLALYFNTFTLEGWEYMPHLLVWATVHAFLGIVLKEGKGL